VIKFGIKALAIAVAGSVIDNFLLRKKKKRKKSIHFSVCICQRLRKGTILFWVGFSLISSS